MGNKKDHKHIQIAGIKIKGLNTTDFIKSLEEKGRLIDPAADLTDFGTELDYVILGLRDVCKSFGYSVKSIDIEKDNISLTRNSGREKYGL